jgi:hypothetical protein
MFEVLGHAQSILPVLLAGVEGSLSHPGGAHPVSALSRHLLQKTK